MILLLRLAICDDDPDTVEKIESFLERLQDPLLEYDVFFDGYELEDYQLKTSQEYDIYLLDIEMERMDGLTFAKRLRDVDSRALIIFITGFSKYVYDVFEVFTFDFILKPVDFERLKHTMDKAFSYLKIARSSFVFSFRKNSFTLPCDRIIYIDKSGRKAYIHTTDNTYQCNMTVEEVWKQLDPHFFAAIRKSCIVNLSYVTEIVRDELILKDGKRLFVGRDYKQQVKIKHLHFLRSRL